MFSKRCLTRQVRDLKEELLTANAVIQTLSNKNFEQAVQIKELKQKLEAAEKESKHWRKLAHEADDARLNIVRRVRIE